MSSALSIVGSSRENGERDAFDFYPTPAYATEALLDREVFAGNIWECASGNGAISRVIEQRGKTCCSSDIQTGEWVYGLKGIDFLVDLPYEQIDSIVTNPPYALALDFVLRAKQVARYKFAFLLKTVFLESEKRYSMFQDTQFPLRCVYQFSKRLTLTKGGIDMKNKGMIAYAWFVWDKEYDGKPYIEWII